MLKRNCGSDIRKRNPEDNVALMCVALLCCEKKRYPEENLREMLERICGCETEDKSEGHVALRCFALLCVALRCLALLCVALCCFVLLCVALHLEKQYPEENLKEK